MSKMMRSATRAAIPAGDSRRMMPQVMPDSYGQVPVGQPPLETPRPMMGNPTPSGGKLGRRFGGMAPMPGQKPTQQPTPSKTQGSHPIKTRLQQIQPPQVQQQPQAMPRKVMPEHLGIQPPMQNPQNPTLTPQVMPPQGGIPMQGIGSLLRQMRGPGTPPTM